MFRRPKVTEMPDAAEEDPREAQAAREGRGAVSLDGRLIDYASIRMAESRLAKADVMQGAGST